MAEGNGIRFISRLRLPAISLSVLVAVLYLLGFASLFFPIRGVIATQDWTLRDTVALHAVSEVPRTVIIGKGILAFAIPSLVIAATMLPAYLIILYVLVRPSSQPRAQSGKGARRGLRNAIVRRRALRSAIIVSPLWILGFSDTLVFSPRVSLGVFVFASFVGVVGWFAGWTLLYYGIDIDNRRVRHEGAFTWAIALFILVAGLVATPNVALADKPPLPEVAISVNNEAATRCGFLAGHTDGAWHVLTHDKEFISLPNASVKEVNVQPCSAD